MSPHRDPETGKFVSGDQFTDIEVVSFGANAGVQAANLGGGTGFGGGSTDIFEGLKLIDYDEVVDRNEELRLLYAAHSISVFANSTQTADSTIEASVEVSADPVASDATLNTVQPAAIGIGPDDAVGRAETEDSIDLIGRILEATGHGPFTDGASGTGGGGSAGEDDWEGTEFPAEFGRFHPRDELFMNGALTAWNVSDAGIHVALTGQHVYGVVGQ